jgi:hypoxanthine phosphoribosyltransferase
MSIPPDALRRTGGIAIKRIVFDEMTIAGRVREMGQEITAAYPAGDLLLLGLLKGSFIFMADLARAIERPLQVDFMVASSYGKGTTSSGNVRLLFDPATDLAGKHVLVVEDIIDTGSTLQRLLSLLGARQPASLAVCALLDKKIAPPTPEVRFVGFECPPSFLVGYGLDHSENYRHLPFIADLG